MGIRKNSKLQEGTNLFLPRDSTAKHQSASGKQANMKVNKKKNKSDQEEEKKKKSKKQKAAEDKEAESKLSEADAQDLGTVSKNGEVYRSFGDETPAVIADKLNMDVQCIVDYNRDVYHGIRKNSKLQEGTNLFLPRDSTAKHQSASGKQTN